MTTHNNDITPEVYNNIAYEFANTLIGDGQSILTDRDNNPDTINAFHMITTNCNDKILKVINGKKIYPNWFLDPTNVKSTGKCTTSHFTFRKAINDVLKEKIGEDHKIYIKYVVVNKKEKLFGIHFFHHNKKKISEVQINETIDVSWISHTSGNIINDSSLIIQHNPPPWIKSRIVISNNDSSVIQHNSTPTKSNTKKNKYSKTKTI